MDNNIITLPQAPKRRKPPGRRKNADLRVREHLTGDEVMRLMKAAKTVGRHRMRDAALILTAYRHAFRVSELVGLRWDQIDFSAGHLYVKRLKKGTSSTQPIIGDELRNFRRLQREYLPSPYVFSTERGGPLSPDAFQWIIKRAGQIANIPFPVHPHMLRHACGYKLANDGRDTRAIQGYLGHRNIQHTVRYTDLAPDRFKDFWSE